MVATELNYDVIAELRQLLSSEKVLSAEEAGKAYTKDFGRLRYETPLVVVKCQTTEDVATVVRYANKTKIPINPRGQAHSQNNSATSDGGILLDTSGLDTIFSIDADALTATCGAGLTWHELVKQTLPLQMLPPVLTTNLNVSLGGTLSVGGLGVATFRYGSQADNVVALEVVTGLGDVVTCSATENEDLFNVVRAGLGQFGIITKAIVKLRKCKPNIRKYFLLYEDVGALMEDCTALMELETSKFGTIEATCRPCVQGTKSVGEGLQLGTGVQLFAYWLFPLHLTVEYDDGEELDDAALLAGLQYHKHLHTDNLPQYESINRMEPLFELMKLNGAWEDAHPWMDTILPWTISQVFIEQLLEVYPPNALGPQGQILFWPSRTDTSSVPMLPIPKGDYAVGLGMLPTIPHFAAEMVTEKIEAISDFSVQVGAKRYLSGLITFTTADEWASHYGDAWPLIVAAKETYDPNHVLSPGLIQYN